MSSFQSIAPIQPITTTWTSPAAESTKNEESGASMFSQIFTSLINNVKETDAAKNEAYYALATGELDNPAQATIAATQASVASELLVQMRDRTLDAYSELMRISL